MNLQDDTIQLLVNLVEREQRWLDRTQPDCQDYDHRFRALLLPPQVFLFPGGHPAGDLLGQYCRFVRRHAGLTAAGLVNHRKMWYFEGRKNFPKDGPL